MLKLYGAPICSTCREVKQLLDDKGIPYEYVDITESTKNLRAFLAMRDTLPVYDEAKAEGLVHTPRAAVLLLDTLHEDVLHFNTTRVLNEDPAQVDDVTRAEKEARAPGVVVGR